MTLAVVPHSRSRWSGGRQALAEDEADAQRTEGGAEVGWAARYGGCVDHPSRCGGKCGERLPVVQA